MGGWTPSLANFGSETVFSPAHIGAGGYLTGLDVAPDGTRVVRADVGGCFIWDQSNFSTPQWRQLFTATSMPSGHQEYGGCWEIRIAYSDTSILYAIDSFGYLYFSDNQGLTWYLTNLPQIVFPTNYGPNSSPNKWYGEKMIVDPANPDIVYVITPAGIYRSLNATSAAAGTDTYSLISTATIPAYNGDWGGGLAFDLSGGTIVVSGQTRTKNIYIPTWGTGVFRSTDGGQTFSGLSSSALGGPVNVFTAQIDSAGVYYCSENSGTGQTQSGKTWMYRSSAWTEIKPNGSSIISGAVCVFPNNPGQVWFPINIGGNANSGFTMIGYGTFPVGEVFGQSYPSGNGAVASADIPWLANYSGMNLGNMRVDPNTNLVCLAEGCGFWLSTAEWPTTFTAMEWNGVSTGIEEMVTNEIVCPNGIPQIACWDRPCFSLPNLKEFPSSYGTNNDFVNAPGGSSVDYASSDPSFIAVRAYGAGSVASGFSPDEGETWSIFSGSPTSGENLGGCIAAATPQNMVMCAANNGAIWFTQDQGETWTPCAGLPTSNWIYAYYIAARVIAADRVNIGTFYALHSTGGVSTLYVSEDGGVSWSTANSFGGGSISPNAGANCKLKAAPWNAGHLWYTDGLYTPSNSSLMFASDGGLSFEAIGTANGYAHDVTVVQDFGFGAPILGGDGYPSIYIYGEVDGENGAWRSDDQAQTWQFLGDYLDNNIDTVKCVSGDLTTHGRCFFGYSGSGACVGNIGSFASGAPRW